MEKRSELSLILILIFLFSVNLVFAASNDSAEKSYSCLKNQLGTNCGNTQSTSQSAFNLLAMSHDSKIQSDCKKSLNNKKNKDCWPDTDSSNSCTIKSTSLAILALKTIGDSVDKPVKWLLNKKKSSIGLIWYLEIDSDNETLCEINGREFTITENKKITGNDPSGLIKSYNDYWFQILDTNKNFSISCNKDFITTLIYQRADDSVYHISSQTHSAAAGDSTNEKVESYCFSASTVCDYEGTLWAALALQKSGEDVSPYIPYIFAMSNKDENKKYLPSAFLYMLNRLEDFYYIDLKNLQKQGKYWDEGGNKFYDTSLAILALGDESSANSARDYLLSQRESSGCWRSDTAFILFSAFTKAPVQGDGGGTSKCEDFNYNCASASECDVENKIDLFCSGTDICCKVAPKKQKCSEKQGIVCNTNQQCSGNLVIASDTQECCLDSCQEIQPLENECINQGYSCKPTCSSDENEQVTLSETCFSNNKCCSAKTTSGSSWTLIIILIILILLAVLAILFRNKLKIWWFKFKSKFKSSKGPSAITRPTTPPPYRPLFQRPRQMIPRQQIPSQQTRTPIKKSSKTNKDKEFEETMKKLREMSR